jgi:hypothetical protein
MFLFLKGMIVTLGVLGITTSFASDNENPGRKSVRKLVAQQTLKEKEPIVKEKVTPQKPMTPKAKEMAQQGGRKAIVQQGGRKPSWGSAKPASEVTKKMPLTAKPIIGGAKKPPLMMPPKTKEPIVCLDMNTLGAK